MSAKQETFYVAKSKRGWIVKAEKVRGRLGPYSNRAQAVLMAVSFAKDNPPSRVKVQNWFGGWWTEKIFEAQNPDRPVV